MTQISFRALSLTFLFISIVIGSSAFCREVNGINRGQAHVSANAIVASGMHGDNLTWTLDKNGLLTIEGTGEMITSEDSDFPWYLYDSYIKEVCISDGVTSIADYAFWNCESITSINIPNTVRSIGEGVFLGCSSLSTVNIPDGVTSIAEFAFGHCQALTSISIPNSVINIEKYAFSDCTTLTSITIPNGVKDIGRGVFSECIYEA